MVTVSLEGDHVKFDVQGWDKFWALKSQLDVPLAHITSVRIAPEEARGWWHGIRMPGTLIPGLITAGTFYQFEGASFYDVHDPEQTIVLELDHEHYKRLVVEVEDPVGTTGLLEAALKARRP